MYLPQVIAGLETGQASFRRHLDGGGEERVEALDDGQNFLHTVDGLSYGGVNTLPITVLLNGRWATDGWERI